MDSDIVPVYTMHQIGFIENGSCFELNLPRLVARADDKFYNFRCSRSASGSCLTGRLTASNIICLKDGHNVTCPVTKSVCSPHCSYNLESGLMLTTQHKVYRVLKSGIKLPVEPINGSMYIPWDGISHVDVANVESPQMGTFFPPTSMSDSAMFEILPVDMYFDIASTYRMKLNLSTIRSLGEDIESKSRDQDNLLKKMYSNKTHFGVLSGIGSIAILLSIIGICLKCCPCLEHLYNCSWCKCNQRYMATTSDESDV